MRLPKSVFLSVKLASTNSATRERVSRFGNAVSYPDVLFRSISYNGATKNINRCNLSFIPAERDEGLALTLTFPACWSAVSRKPFYTGQGYVYSGGAGGYGGYRFDRLLLSPEGAPSQTSLRNWSPGSLELTVIEKCCPYS